MSDPGKQLLFWDDEPANEGLQPLLDTIAVALGRKRGQPKDHVRHDVPPVDRLELIRALQLRSVTNPAGGAVLMNYMGWAVCRICGKRLGTRDFAAHGFVWPEKADHYLVAHQVWTPECAEMLAAVRRQQRKTRA